MLQFTIEDDFLYKILINFDDKNYSYHKCFFGDYNNKLNSDKQF